MTMPDTNAVGEQHDSQPDAQAGHPAPASTDTDAPGSNATADTDAPDDDDDDQDGNRKNREAAKYRRRLRDTEAERDALRDMLAKTRQSIVDNAVQAAGLDPRLMVAAGHTLDTLVGDDGRIDHGELSEAIANTAREFNIAPKVRPPQPNPQQGRPGPPTKGESSWSKALKGNAD